MSPPVRLAVALALLASACGGDQADPRSAPSPEAAYPITLTDDEGREVTLEEPPDRIVTFAPSHTETVFALDLGDRIVGVSGPFDDHPPEAQSIEHVSGRGGTEPNVEKVVSLEPDILLTAFIGGEWKDRLEELDVPVFTTLAASFDDAVEDIRTIGGLLGAAEPGEELASDMEDRAATVEARPGEPVTCFLEVSDLFTVGPGSLEFDLLERAGCEPVTASADEPYPQWSVEQLLEDDPDVYLASEFGQSVEEVTDRPGIRDLTAVQDGRVHLVDGDLISRPGPRLVEGLEALADALRR